MHWSVEFKTDLLRETGYVMVICDGNLCWCNKQLVMGGGGVGVRRDFPQENSSQLLYTSV